MINTEEDPSEIVRLKDHVILKRGDDLILTRINTQPRVKFFTATIDLGNIIGKPFWSVYKMEHTPSKNNRLYELEYCDPNEVMPNVVDGTKFGSDNRSIQDDNNAQALSREEILEMRNNGHSSQDILHELIRNSSSFNKKTGFAQQKYVKRKSKKYSDFIQILKPDIRLLAKILLKGTFTSSFMGLRIDTFSQIPTALAFQPDGTYIIYENNCHGLVIAQLLSLLSTNGKLLNIITENYPHSKLKALKAMQFSPEKLEQLINIRSYFFKNYSNENEGDYDFKPEDSPESEDTLKRKNIGDDDTRNKRTLELEKQEEVVRNLIQKKADGLLFVCKEEVSSEINVMLQYLAPSRPFVVYSQWKEPLMLLFSELKKRKDVISVRIIENHSRKYQILQDRTHPETMMNSGSGYLLMGYTIELIVDEK